MRLIMLLLGWLACSGAACGEELYRCIDSDGHVSYQMRLCGPGQRLQRRFSYVPEPDSVPAASAHAATPARARAAPRRARATRATARVARPVDACQDARTKREAALRKLGLKRRYDDLSRLDVPVREACRY